MRNESLGTGREASVHLHDDVARKTAEYSGLEG